MRSRLLLSVTLLAIAGVARSADPQPYVVHLAPTSNGALNASLRASSQLDSLRTKAPAGPFALVDRAGQDIERLQTVLSSFGYYRGTVAITIDGEPLEDPDLPGKIAALPKNQPARVEVRADPGALFHIRKVIVEGPVEAAAIEAMRLPSGAAAIAADVLAARERLLTALEERGHAYARVDQPLAYLDAAEPLLDIRIKVDPGPIYRLGPVRVEGLRKADPAFVRRHLTLTPGATYRPSAIEEVRGRLLGLGIFAAVSVRLPPREAVQGDQLPITFGLVEQSLHTVTLNAAYSSDLGASAGASWTNRDTFGHAEQLTLSASVIDVGCTACNGVGYTGGVLLNKPDFLQNDQSLQLGLTALKQYLAAYDQIGGTASATLVRKLSSVWTVSAGATLEQEQVRQGQFVCPPRFSFTGEDKDPLAPADTPWCHYTLLGFPVSARYDSTDLSNPLAEPTHGSRVSLSITPTHSLFGSSHPTFIFFQTIASAYFDLARLHWSEPGRSVIALRGNIAEAVGAQQFSLPPDQRLYGGGSATVRGYAYQSIGPEFKNGNPSGGTALGAGTLEVRQRLVGNYGLAAFVDAGQVTAGAVPFRGHNTAYCRKRGVYISPLEPKISIGYGLGMRYFTPVGPIRFDVAAPANPQACDAAFEVYIGLGEAF